MRLANEKTIHFIPENGIFIYFRSYENETVMVILNNNLKGSHTIKDKRYSEILDQYTEGRNIVTGRKVSNLEKITINAKTAKVIELK